MRTADASTDDPRPRLRDTTTGAAPRRRWPSLLLAAVLVLVAVAVASRGRDEGGSSFGPVAQVRPTVAEVAELTTAPEPGRLAPNFLLQTLEGQTVRLSDLRGRPVFLNFWATWCIFCVGEMPAMQKLADRYGDQIVVVGINVGEDVETARRFAAREGIRYPLVLDSDREVTRVYEVRAMPTSLFIDRDGVIRSVKYGPVTPPEMEERIAPLLSAQGE